MELRHIRYFVRAAELLHFTHAAESLFISQPTLSTHIQQLEEEVGLPLFDRIGRHVRLTEAGNIFLENANRALRVLDDAREEIAELNGTVTGTLRLASLLIFGHEMLPTWISDFNALYPQVQIAVKTGTGERVEGQLVSGNVDIALTFMPPASPQLEGCVLFTEELIYAVSADHPLAERDDITFEEACQSPLALVGRTSPARQILNKLFAERKVVPNIVVEIDDPKAISQIISAGHVGTFMARRVFKDPEKFRCIPISDFSVAIDFGVVWVKDERLSPPARAFLQHIRKCSRER